MKKVLLSLILCVVAACAPKQDAPVPPASGSFGHNLATEYEAFAETLKELDHPELAKKMREKAKKAHKGYMPKPEAAGEKHLAAYEALHQQMTETNKRVLSQMAARAQILYDCQTFEALDADTISGCEQEFNAAIAELSKTSMALDYRFQSTLRFEADSAILTPLAKKKISKLTSRLLSGVYDHLVVNAHTAPSGDEKKDIRLAAKRAKAVAAALYREGVPYKRMDLNVMGSQSPLPNVEDPARLDRVEIKVY
jgi:outer membrane protein OmpA-like peptidoglycan-associated protein